MNFTLFQQGFSVKIVECQPASWQKQIGGVDWPMPLEAGQGECGRSPRGGVDELDHRNLAGWI